MNNKMLKQFFLLAIVFVFTTTMYAAGFKVPVTVAETGGKKDTVYIGVDTLATDTINVGLGERELPPMPPTGVFDARLYGRKNTTQYLGQGTKRDYRDFINAAQVDTYRVKFQLGTGARPWVVSWDTATLRKYGTAWSLMDVSGGSLLNVNMFDSTTVHISSNLVSAVYIIKTGALFSLSSYSATSVAFGSVKLAATKKDSVTITNAGNAALHITSVTSNNSHFTVTPSNGTIAASGSSKFYISYNPVSLGSENGKVTFVSNASTSPESVLVSGVGSDTTKFRTFNVTNGAADFAGTFASITAKLVKGSKTAKYFIVKGTVNLRTAAERVMVKAIAESKTNLLTFGVDLTGTDASKTHGWLSYKNAKAIGAFVGIAQTGSPFPIDSQTHNNAYKGDKRTGKAWTKAIAPGAKTPSNKLWADGTVFKFNLMASQYGVTPANFGALTLDTAYTLFGKNLQGVTLTTFGKYVDSLMTFWSEHKLYDTAGSHGSFTNTQAKMLATLGQLDTMILRINNGFYGALSTFDSNSRGTHDYIDSASVDSKGKDAKYAIVLRGVKTAKEGVSFLKNVLGKSDAVNFTQTGSLEMPVKFELNQNYPNPFNPSTTISFLLSEQATVTLKVYNVLGQEVASLLNNATMQEGNQEIAFNASHLASGVYFYRLSVNGNEFQAMKKMLLLK